MTPLDTRDTIAAIATGGIVSAVGIVRVSGPEALSLMDALFRPADGKKMSDHPDRLLVYGRLLDAQERLLDLCMCTVRINTTPTCFREYRRIRFRVRSRILFAVQ